MENSDPLPSSSNRSRCVGWSGENRAGKATWGCSSNIGRRKEMEDAVATVAEFFECTCEEFGGCAATPGSSEVEFSSFFGVYDGHGGSQVATYCAKRIHEAVADKWLSAEGNGWQRRWQVAFTEGFDVVDNELVTEAVAPDIVGSTAVAVVVSGCQIIASNCGDSRAILCRRNQTIQLTVDHKPNSEEEVVRIEAAGGKVFNWKGPRVMGVLAVSRSIGDRYMRPYVIPVPEISFTPRTEEDECLIVACDGLWDVLSNEEVGKVARRILRHQHRNGVVDGESQPPAQVVADYLVKLAYSKYSVDNISIIVVDLKTRNHPPSKKNSDHINSGEA